MLLARTNRSSSGAASSMRMPCDLLVEFAELTVCPVIPTLMDGAPFRTIIR